MFNLMNAGFNCSRSHPQPGQVEREAGRLQQEAAELGHRFCSPHGSAVFVQRMKLLAGLCAAVNVGVKGMNVPVKHSTSSH